MNGDRPQRFVIHKHRGRRVHYDVCLEMDGALKSWAVPRGISFDPKVKRMAVKLDDRPLEYADFEGVVPEGNYGAGATIIWDRGTWRWLDDPDAGYDKGKVIFELSGFKLRGAWELIRTKKSDKDWLLFKKRDAYAVEDEQKELAEESILSGLTVEELASGTTRAGELRTELEKLGTPKKRVRAVDQAPMLAETADQAFSKPGWIFELKYDGFRLMAACDHGEARLAYRRGADSTKTFPDIAHAIAKLPYDRLLLDGEVVVLDEGARPSFQRLQKRTQLLRAQDIERAAIEYPATYYAFDLLAFEEYDLRNLPLIIRKELLKKVLPRSGPLRFCDHVEEKGAELFAQVEKMELEGIIAKRSASIYRAGRCDDWLKIKVDQVGDFAVIGYTIPKDSRTGFGALHLAYFEDQRWVYTGRVGGGFAEKELVAITARLRDHQSAQPPSAGTMPPGPGRDHVWVEPELVVKVRYKEITEDGLLRQPVFLDLREGKKPIECTREFRADHAPESAPATPSDPPYSNLDKIFWPKEKYTKGDLIEYYRAVAPWLLPYLKDRPVVLTRYPDGIEGKNFFQKDAPPYVPAWVRTERLWSEQASREIDYFIVDKEETLLYLANLATIPLHLKASRMSDLQKPDWCIIDLDPKRAPFKDVVTIALALKELCDAIELPSFVKTSGSTGLHVILPLGGQCTHDQSRALGELISRVIVEQLPEIATIVRPIESRGDRVYLDFLQNGLGRLLVSPLCVRPLPGAPVSMPLRWDEVAEPDLHPQKWTIKNAVARLEALGKDPMIAVLSLKPNLGLVLKKLDARMKAR